MHLPAVRFGLSVATFALAALLSLGAVGAPVASAQQGPTSVFELTRVAEDVYTFRYNTHVTMFIVTDEGVITADPLGQQNALAPEILKTAIRTVTDKPVKYVINTHWGADHGMGGAVFADTAQFISHPTTAQRIAAAADATTPVPTILVSDKYSIMLGGKQVDLYYTGRNQADDYLVVHYPARGAIFAVDFIRSKAVAFRDFANGDIDEWVASLDWIDQNLAGETYLLGHNPGALATKEALRDTRQYLQDLMTAVRNARAAGQADNSDGMIAAVKAELSPKYATFLNFENFLPLNIQGATRSMDQ